VECEAEERIKMNAINVLAKLVTIRNHLSGVLIDVPESLHVINAYTNIIEAIKETTAHL